MMVLGWALSPRIRKTFGWRIRKKIASFFLSGQWSMLGTNFPWTLLFSHLLVSGGGWDRCVMVVIVVLEGNELYLTSWFHREELHSLTFLVFLIIPQSLYPRGLEEGTGMCGFSPFGVTLGSALVSRFVFWNEVKETVLTGKSWIV